VRSEEEVTARSGDVVVTSTGSKARHANDEIYSATRNVPTCVKSMTGDEPLTQTEATFSVTVPNDENLIGDTFSLRAALQEDGEIAGKTYDIAVTIVKSLHGRRTPAGQAGADHQVSRRPVLNRSAEEPGLPAGLSFHG
jgi:hypothetical protein